MTIPNDELAFRERDGAWAGQVRFAVVLRDTTGDEAFRAESDLAPRAKSGLDAKDHAILQMIRERAAVAPGSYRLEITVTDQGAGKPGLLDRIRHLRARGSVETWIEVPRFAPDSLSVSTSCWCATHASPRTTIRGPGAGSTSIPIPRASTVWLCPASAASRRCRRVATGKEGDTFLVQLQ